MARNDGYIELNENYDNDFSDGQYNNDDDAENYSDNFPNSQKKRGKKIKWGVIILFIIIIYLFYDMILGYILGILKLNPAFYKIYLNLEYEIANNTLKGLFYISIMGSLFFLALPSEALFIYYLSSTKYIFFIVIGFLVIGNLIGLIFNYLFGRVLGERVLRLIFKNNFDKYQDRIDRFGGIFLFFGNILPGPIELITVFYGGFKYNFKKYVFFSLMGRLIKYIILFILYMYFWDQISFFYSDIINNLQNLI